MTKKEAIEKIVKLQKLAKSNDNKNEAKNAEEKVKALMVEYKINENDIKIEDKSLAFDDLVASIENFSSKNPSIPSIFGGSYVMESVLEKLKDATDSNKASRLDAITSLVGVASLVFNKNESVLSIKKIIEDTLKKHNL